MVRKGIKVEALSALELEGYRTFKTPTSVALGRLTVLAGTNSSGKSSCLQPLLLLKQTLEAPFDPGPLLLGGENVRLTGADQMLTRTGTNENVSAMTFGFQTTDSLELSLTFVKERGGIGLAEQYAKGPRGAPHHLRAGGSSRGKGVRRWRSFLGLAGKRSEQVALNPYMQRIGRLILDVIHVPGLRGNPSRSYATGAVGETFPGPFDKYVASVVHGWQQHDRRKLAALVADLDSLDLTWKISAVPLSDTEVELRVGRLRKSVQGGAHDLVNIADVGFGVSQCLPIVVALLAARPGQLVYVEQPELHLHPRAQHRLARLLVAASARGVRVVAETHSSLLLLGIQSALAEGTLASDHVRMHWFSRDDHGFTKIASVTPDQHGEIGSWPVDFDDVSLRAQADFMDKLDKATSK